MKWSCGSLIVRALDSASRGLGSSFAQAHCVVFLGKTLYSHSESFHSSEKTVTGEFNAGGNSVMD